MSVKVSAPGKLMLLGDHAVVYGYPCLVTAVDKRLYVEAEIITGTEDEILTPQVKESRFVLESIAYFKERFHISQSVRIKTKGDFSHQVGLGSSSAVTVATFQALSVLFHKKLTKKNLFDLSYKVNLLIQRVGSGFDIGAAVYGKSLLFVTGGKRIEELSISDIPLVVGYSGVKADTPFYIRKVAEAFKTRNAEMHTLFSHIQELVESAYHGLKHGNYVQVGNAMNENHKLLQQLGVSTERLDQMVSSALKAGAWGAKLSGAGGGDCIIALVSDKKRKNVEHAIISAGGEIIQVANNAEGVQIENSAYAKR